MKTYYIVQHQSLKQILCVLTNREDIMENIGFDNTGIVSFPASYFEKKTGLLAYDLYTDVFHV